MAGLPTRAISTVESYGANPSGGTTWITMPSGVVAGDLTVAVYSVYTTSGTPTFTAGANLTTFTQVVNIANPGRTPSHLLAVFVLANTPAALSSAQLRFAVSGGSFYHSGQVIVFKGPGLRLTASGQQTSGAVYSINADVPDLLTGVTAEQVLNYVSVMAQTGNAGAFTTTGDTTSTVVSATLQGPQALLITNAGGPGAHTYSTGQPSSKIAAQLAVTAIPAEARTGKGTLTAFGRVGGARGYKYVTLTARVVSSAATGQVATPGLASIVVPAGVVTGDTIVLVVSAQAGAGPSVTMAATGPITAFSQAVDGRNTTARAQSLSVFVLRNAAASLSGQSLSVQCDCTTATFYYLMQVYVFRGGDLPPYLVTSGNANSGTALSTSVTVAKLTSDAFPVSPILNVANTRNDSGSATTFTGSGLIGQSLYGTLGLMLGGGPVPGAYTYTSSQPVSTVTAQLGFSTVKPVGWDNRHPLVAYGALTAGPGTAAVDPISIRVLAGGAYDKAYYNNPWTITLPAGIKDGDTVVLAVVCCGQFSSVVRPTITEAAGFTRWTPLFNTPGPASSYHRTAAWVYHNATASMSGTTVALTVNGAYYDSCSHRIMVLTPCRVIGNAATTGPDTAGTDVTIANIQQDQNTRVVIAIIAAQNSGTYQATAPQFLSPTIPVIEQTYVNNGSYRNTNILTGWMRDPSVPATFTAAPPAQPRYVVTGQIALSDIPLPNYNVRGGGGGITGYAQQVSRGGRMMLVRFSDYEVSQNITLNPATPAGERIFWFLATRHATATAGPPAGWTQIGYYNNSGLQLWIFTRTFVAGIGGSTIKPTVSPASGVYWASMTRTITGYAVTFDAPAVQAVDYIATTTQTIAMSPTANPGPRATMLSFYAATIATSGSISATAYQSGGLQPYTASGLSLQNLVMHTALTSAGVEQLWQPSYASGVKHIGQIALYDDTRFEAPRYVVGGAVTVTGYGQLTGKGRVGRPGRGGQLTGYAKLGARGLIPDPGMTGFARITVGAGNVADRRPILRPGSITTASGERVRYLRIPISATVHVGDYLLVAVGVVGTARPITPDGWQRLQDTTPVAHGITATVFGRTAGVYDPGGAVIVDTDASANTVVSAALAAWKAPGVVTVAQYPQTSGQLPVRFGPLGANHGGNQRAVAGVAAATDPGQTVQFQTPPASLSGAVPATVQAQDTGGYEPTLAVFIADYDAATDLQGQINAVVPTLALSTVVELVAVDHHEGILTGYGQIHVERGQKLDPPGRMNGYADIIVPAVEGHGVHRGAGTPRMDGYARMRGSQGILADFFRGGRITAYARTGTTDTGHGTHRSGGAPQLAGAGVISSRRPGRTGQAGEITGEGALHAWAQHPYINRIEGYARLTGGGFASRYKHRAVTIGGYGRLIGGPGIKVTTLDLRFTQIRGYARISAEQGSKGPARTHGAASGVPLIGYGRLYFGDPYALQHIFPDSPAVPVTVGDPAVACTAAVVLDDGVTAAATVDEPAVAFTAVVVLDDGIIVPVAAGVTVTIGVLRVGQVYRSRAVYNKVMRPTSTGHTGVIGG